MQVLNVALGGTLRADMNDGESVADHFHRTHLVSTDPGSLLAKEIGDEVEVSCYHHQCVDQIAASLRPVAASTDGTTEALETQEGTASGWLLAVQWHPEDTALVNSAQMRVFEAFIEASRGPQDGIDA
jgi:putative glutamine amidotransferase